MPQLSIHQLLTSEDPLGSQDLSALVSHEEEDLYVDYKLDFDSSSEKSWIELAKDVAAFANSEGGYLVFGVKDGSFEFVGVSGEAERALLDANLIQQKVNRHIDPDQTGIRSKRGMKNGAAFVAVYIPRSRDICVFRADGEFEYPSGKKGKAFVKGQVVVRRSAGNRFAESRDFGLLIQKRLSEFRAQILEGIAQVVEAPEQSHILVVDSKENPDGATEFVISGAPDALAVKGMTFSAVPSSLEQEVAAWIALTEKEQSALPPRDILWRWYESRHSLALSEEQLVRVAIISLRSDVPGFYWLSRCKADPIRNELENAFKSEQIEIHSAPAFIGTAAFFGKRFHARMLRLMGNSERLLTRRKQEFPNDAASDFFR